MRRLCSGLTLIEFVFTALLFPLIVVVLLLFGICVVSSAGQVFVFAVACGSIPIIVFSWCLVAIQQSVCRAAGEDLASPQVIATVPSEFDAALIIDKLSRNGIRAHAVGDYTFGCMAGTQRQVGVVVTREDCERAEAIL